MKSRTMRLPTRTPDVFRWFGPVLGITLAVGAAVLGYLVVLPLIHREPARI